jgi:uncharacterized membrane protein
MLTLPPIPSWDAIHPLIVHFPIALLLLAPVFICISAALPIAKSRPYLIAALIIMILGTGSLFVAASSGEEASELVVRSGGMASVLSAHEKLASNTEVMFSVLSLTLLCLFVIPRLLHFRETRVSTTILPILYLVLYATGLVSLVNTAHAGGRLVHEFGVHAILPPSGNPGNQLFAAHASLSGETE